MGRGGCIVSASSSTAIHSCPYFQGPLIYLSVSQFAVPSSWVRRWEPERFAQHKLSIPLIGPAALVVSVVIHVELAPRD